MQTLTYGYLKPQNSIDYGDQFFPAMEFNIQRLNDHNHDGVNSARLSSTSQNILNSAWVAAPIGGGLYMQTVTMPAGFNYDSCQILFKLSTGEFVYPSVERVNTTSYKLYTNDNSLDYVAVYR